MAPRLVRPLHLGLFSLAWSLVGGLAGGCGQGDECGLFATKCADGRSLDLATLVHAAVAVDLDGDGQTEMVAVTGSGRQLAVGTREGWRSMAFVEDGLSAVAALSTRTGATTW